MAVPSSPFTWSGYQWSIKDSGANSVGPGPNRFAGSQLDLTGTDLTFKLTKIDNVWYSSEVISSLSLGYGKYEWVWDTSKHPSTWDRNPVLGMFIYSFTQQNGTEPEIDWELAQFGDPGSARLWSSNHPATIPSSTEGQGFYSGAVGPYRSTFWWMNGKVYFETKDANGKMIGQNQTVKLVPAPSDEKVRMNLWLIGGTPPVDGLNYEAVMKSFTFTANALATNPAAALTRNEFTDPHNVMLYGPSTSVEGGLLHLPMRADYGNSVRTGLIYDINSSAVVLKMNNVPAGVGEESEVQLRYDADNLYSYIKSGGDLIMRHRSAGVNTQTSVPFDPVAMKYWRFRNPSTLIIDFDTSPDGVNWTNRRSINSTLSVEQRSGLQLNIVAGAWQAEPTPGILQIDGINPNETPSTGSAVGSSSWTGSGTGSAQRSGTASGLTAWTGTGTGPNSAQGNVRDTTHWQGAAQGSPNKEGLSQFSTQWSGTATSGTQPGSGSPLSATVDPWSTVTLTGTGAGAWQQTMGIPVTLVGSDPIRTFMAPAAMTQQELRFTYGATTSVITVRKARHGRKKSDGSIAPMKMIRK